MLLRTPKDIGAIVRQRRRELRIAQHTLAERVGVSRQWIIDCEKGKPRAELGLVLRTLTVLGVRLSAAVGSGSQVKSAPDAPDIDSIVAAARKPRR
jgi:HTH-type transcriptional regulator / antitoxin HipB